jgi:hypothetical protein
MPHRHTAPRWRLPLVVLGLAVALAPAAARAQPPSQADASALQRAFAAAAREWGVPEGLLLAVAYNLSRWEQHAGAPSAAGGYGPLHLTAAEYLPRFDGRGDKGAAPIRPAAAPTGAPTLELAAALTGASAEELKRDPAQNIRGGAALLARYARDTLGGRPAGLGDWYGAVAAYSGSPEAAVALDFAETAYATLRQGAARTTGDGQFVALAAQEVEPRRETARSLGLRAPAAGRAECAAGLDCVLVPAAYAHNGSDPTDYGNYDFADRPNDGLALRYIVIHNTEISYNTTLRAFQRPSSYVSSHYLVRASDGQVAQLVRPKNVGWHAGNWYFNGLSIGIEHEGVAIEGAAWYSEQMYRASARLVAALAQRYGIPLDRAHIIGHDEIPGPTPATQPGMHWDPGPFWDWERYMQLLGAAQGGADNLRAGAIVTISPDFQRNRPPLSYCYDAEANDCRPVPAQPSNFVYLYSAPAWSAPLIANPYIASEPTRAYNWANKALSGQQFYRVERRGDWDAIFFGGQLAWFYNPGGENSASAAGIVVTPKAGRETVPLYGRAYPEPAAYPTGVVTQTLAPIYDLPAGQRYVAVELVRGSYYSAPTYAPTLEASSHRVVAGQEAYYRIYFNHRFAFVKAGDVEVIDTRPVR